MEPIRASEINDIIRKQIENFDTACKSLRSER